MVTSTITPAEVGGLVDAQTEARAIYERGINAGEQYSIVSEIATALAAKDAELAEAWQRYVDANEARIDAEAALAEARKALEDLREELACEIEERIRHLGDDMGDTGAARISDLRRAREAQGGENV